MPGTVMKGNISSIEEKLSASLGKKSNSDNLKRKLAAQSRSILLQNINFVPAVNESNTYWKQVADKYSRSNGERAMNAHSDKTAVINGVHRKLQRVNDAEGLPTPKVVLYDGSKLQLDWRAGARKGCGLQNTHNTCFLNSVLQALTYTPAFNNFLASKEHSRKCENRGLCMICVMEEHIRTVGTRNVWTPWQIIKGLRSIAKHFSHGRQEDAHEFLRYFIEAMTKSALLSYSKLDVYSKNTTALHQIFGGYLRSQVKCLNCEHKSNTFDPMLDLALDIKNAGNLNQALESFTKAESLHGDNCYSCERCKKKVKAIKRFSIHQAPTILTVQLKRFDMAKLHSKVNKPVSFPHLLNLRQYMSNKQGKPVTYSLYAVLVHSGSSASFGHYYTYAKVPTGQWYLFNDSHVSPSSLESVLRQQAYILFYSKNVASANHMTQQSHMIGPVKKPQLSNQNMIYNGKQIGNQGIPVQRKIPPSATTPKPPTPIPGAGAKIPTSVPGATQKVMTSAASQPSKINVDRNRQKISFGIKPMGLLQESNQPEVPLVMKIKDGKVVSNTASPPDTGKTTIFAPSSNNKLNAKRPSLVPYNGDNSSSSSDDEEVGAINSSKTTVTNGNGAAKMKKENGVKKVDDKKWTNGKHNKNSQATKLMKPTPVVNGHGEKSKEVPNSPRKAMFVNNEDNKKQKESASSHFEPILDERLKTTTEVPGAYTSLDRLANNGFKTPTLKTQTERKELSITLSSPEPSKINSTSKWTVLEQDQKSPSLASSNGSINSTSEWKINTSEEKGASGTGGAHARKVNGTGLTVNQKATPTSQKDTPTPQKATPTSPVSWSSSDSTAVPVAIVENVHHNGNQSKVVSQENSTNKSTPKVDIKPADILQNKEALKTSEKHSLHPSKQGSQIHDDTKSTQSSPHITEHSAKKKRKKHKKHHHDVKPHQENPVSDNTTTSAKTQDPDDLNKKKEEQQPSAAEIVEKEKSSVLSEEHGNGDHVDKKKKKKKRKKKHKHRDYEPGEIPDSPVSSKRSHSGEEADEDAYSKRAKVKYDKEEKTGINKRGAKIGDSDEKTFSKHTKVETSDEKAFDKRAKTEDEREEGEWVEKSKDNVDEQPTGQQNKLSSNKSVHVAQWDQSRQEAEMNRKAWDGSRKNNSDVLSQLQSSSIHGYGPQVSSWAGGVSHIDNELYQERHNKKRSWEDDYEDELDRGKTKKVKTYKHEHQSQHGHNVFQKHQDMENRLKQHKDKNGGASFGGQHQPYHAKSGDSDHHGKQHPHHHGNRHDHHHGDKHHSHGADRQHSQAFGGADKHQAFGSNKHSAERAFGKGDNNDRVMQKDNNSHGNRFGNDNNNWHSNSNHHGKHHGNSRNYGGGSGYQGNKPWRGGNRGNSGYRGGYKNQGNRSGNFQNRNHNQRGRFNRY